MYLKEVTVRRRISFEHKRSFKNIFKNDYCAERDKLDRGDCVRKGDKWSKVGKGG